MPNLKSQIRQMGALSAQEVWNIEQHALAKIRNRPELAERFRQAVHEQRRALDARPGNDASTDIDADVEVC